MARRVSLLASLSFLIALPFSGCTCANPNVATGDGGTSAGDGDGDSVAGDGDGDGDGDGTITDGGQLIPGADIFEVLTDAGVVLTDPQGNDYTCYPIICDGHDTECGDCVDNDGDGLVDWRDPECLGPCDNTEGPTLAAGVGGANRANCKVDCYFDYGNGPGNDECNWDHECDELEPESNRGCFYDADLLGTEKCPAVQSDTCQQVCAPFTPNGCDCFGCCTFPELESSGPNGAREYVWIGAMDDDNNPTCTFDDVTDEVLCPKCTPVENCLNECGRCELCIGKTTVPADCYDTPVGDGDGDGDGTGTPDAGNGGDGDGDVGGGNGGDGDGDGTVDPPVNPGQCPAGVQACGLPGQADCDVGSYCISGCCQFLGG